MQLKMVENKEDYDGFSARAKYIKITLSNLLHGSVAKLKTQNFTLPSSLLLSFN